MLISLYTLYNYLEIMDEFDLATSALYRQMAQEVLASPEIDLSIRQAIAERLNLANQTLARKSLESEDSY
jgi:hypothetical protein